MLSKTHSFAFFNIGVDYNTTLLTQSYIIASTNTDTGYMNFTSFDNCGNANFTLLEVRRDIQVPDQSSITTISEGSPYVHKSAGFDRLWYSDHMISPVSVTLDVSAVDPGVVRTGIATITFPAIGDEAALNVSIASPFYSRSYSIGSSDTTFGDLTLTVYDNVGNTHQIPLEVIRDTTSPLIQYTGVTDPLYDPNENELDADGNWYDQGELSSGFSITSSPSDPLSGSRVGSGIYTVYLDWDSTNDGDDNFNIDLGADGDDIILGIDDDSDGNITLTLTAHDNVGNTQQTNITIRFDNTSPTTNNTTPLHQGGSDNPIIRLSGTASDLGAGIKNITLSDLSGNHFPSLYIGGYNPWNVDNSSSLDIDVTPGENVTVNVTVFDNVFNAISYEVNITYHTFQFIIFNENLPTRVEINEPNPLDWNITIGFEYDGVLVDSGTIVTEQFINQSTLLTQFHLWINGTALPIKAGSLIWLSAPSRLQFTVILPDSSSTQEVLDHLTIGDDFLKDILVEWYITTSTTSVFYSYLEPDVVSYHDLEVFYVSDDLNITERDNPDIMNVTLQLSKDYQPMTPAIGPVGGVNFQFRIDGQVASVVGTVLSLGGGLYEIPIQLPAGLPTGNKSIDFIWRYDPSEYFYVTDANFSLDVVTYHGILVTASIPASMQLFEIDSDFNFSVDFTVFEDNGNGSGLLPLTKLGSLSSFQIRSLNLINQTDTVVESGGGAYSFTFSLYDENTTSSWVGNQVVRIQIKSPESGLLEWGEATIIGHDLEITFLDIFARLGSINQSFFDPDETTDFELQIRIRDDNGSGFVPVTNLNSTNFIEMFLMNKEDPLNQYVKFNQSEIDEWYPIPSPVGEYAIPFTLPAFKASDLGLGFLNVNVTIVDNNGHLEILQLISVLESKDFVTLLGLKWILTPYGNFSFLERWEYSAGDYIIEIASNATEEYTFRVSTGSEITLSFWIFALEDPTKQPSEASVNVLWKNTTGDLNNKITTGNITINLTSSQPVRQAFVVYADGNEEDQLVRYAPWRVWLEWDNLIAQTDVIDDTPETTDDESVLNVNGTFSMTYSALFNRSVIVNDPRGVRGCNFLIDLGLRQHNGTQWGTQIIHSFEHLDGAGFIIYDLGNGTLTIIDDPQAPRAADGMIEIKLEFHDVIQAELDVRITNETLFPGDTTPYRVYSSYGDPYRGPVYSFVQDASGTFIQDTIIWTKFKASIITNDSRIPEWTDGFVFVNAYYAHDPSLRIEDVTVTIYNNRSRVVDPNDVWNQSNWVNTFAGILHGKGLAKISILKFEDEKFGISLFEDKTTNADEVYVEIIWDRVDFFISLVDDQGRPWGAELRYSVEDQAHVLIEAYYAYDRSPFYGNVSLFYRDYFEWELHHTSWDDNTTIDIDYDPLGQNRTGPDRVLFEIDSITWDIHGLDGTTTFQVFVKDKSQLSWLNLYWDRIIIEFDYEIVEEFFFADSVIPGVQVNITMNTYYEADRKPITNLIYNLTKNGEAFYENNRRNLFFLDSELFEANNTYTIIEAYDIDTNLIGAFFPNGSSNPSITIPWVDTEFAPELLDHDMIDLGNGILVFWVLVSDDDLSGKFYGSGIEDVTIHLHLEGVLQPGDVHHLNFSSSRTIRMGNASLYTGMIKTDDSDPRNDFSYNSRLNYTIILQDKRKNINLYIISDKTLVEDSDPPDLIGNVSVTYSLDRDGNLVISCNASDAWSGVDRAVLRFFNAITDQLKDERNMTDRSIGSGVLEFQGNSTLTVGEEIRYEIAIYDTHGNFRLIEGSFEVEDASAPYIKECSIFYEGFGEFILKLTVGDNGSPITNAELYYTVGDETSPANVTESVIGGTGALVSQGTEYIHTKSFYSKFMISSDLIQPRTVKFQLNITDSAGNVRSFDHSDLVRYISASSEVSDVVNLDDRFEIPANVFEVFLREIETVILIVIGVLLVIAFLAVRHFRTIGGFDKKQVLADLVKISENEVWERNDDISVGLVASFFDQVKGPIPVIVYPEKLRASEAMLANLSDRSFSTLGFVSSPSEDKNASFRFQIGGDKCTVFGYAYAFENPEARGGQENLSLCFLIRPPWGNLENLNKFSSELLERGRKIRDLMKEQADLKLVQKEMEQTRNFLTRAMLTFQRKYKKEFVE